MAEFSEAFDKTALKQGMSIDSVYKFLTDKGIEGYWLNEDTLVFETCCHNHIGEGSKKLYYYDNTKLFSCYTGCGETFDIFELLNKINVVETGEELDLNDCVRDYVYSQSFLFTKKQEFNDEIEENKEYIKPKLQYFNPNDLLEFPRVYSKDWLQEGVNSNLHKKYNVRFNWFSNSLLFPHYDEFWNLIGIRQRFLADESVEVFGKYKPFSLNNIIYSNPTSFYLFGLNYNSLNIRKIKKAIVFESEKSVMIMDSVLGEKNNIGVSCLGMHFSRHQFELLKNLGVEEIVFAYDRQFKKATIHDNEFGNLLATYRNIYKRFSSFGIKISFILDDNLLTNYKDSPIDRGYEIFNNLYHKKRNIEELDEIYLKELTPWDQMTQLPDEEDMEIFA